MKILVIGSGGREHALVWKLSQSPRVSKIFCAPGNAGIQRLADCVAIAATDIKKLARFARKNKIDLTVVGPEVPLTLGIVDVFEKMGLRVFGPDKRAAALEGSKIFTKKFLQDHDIPTAGFSVFRKSAPAIRYITQVGAPLVIKADGLAAGKGVIVAKTTEEACQAVTEMMEDSLFGSAGSKIVIEDFMAGEEASFLAFTDGKTVLPLPTSQDHKAIFEGDQGPNTGGMGAYSPAPVVTDALHKMVMEKIMLRTVQGMAAIGRPYKGILYAGLMIDKGQARVVEFNCRFGDPEAQPLLMRLKTDLVDIMEAVIDQRLHEITLEIDPRPSVCVVMASEGYPGDYKKGQAINGLRAASKVEGVEIFHAGTSIKQNRTVTAGGRVLGITAIGNDLQTAITRAYAAVDCISWPGAYVRRDIGHRALARGVKTEAPQPAVAGEAMVGILMGSDSDLPVMEGATSFLRSLGIPYEITVASAHRTPARACRYAETAAERGLKVIIAGAGMAAHLAGVLAAHTTLPVIGVPIDASALNGLDALLSTVMMPPGVPVAAMGIGKSGAKNAAIFAAQILATADAGLARKLADYKVEMAAEVDRKAAALAEKLAGH